MVDTFAPQPACGRVLSRVYSDFHEMEESLQGAHVTMAPLKAAKWRSGLVCAPLQETAICFGWESTPHATHAAGNSGFIVGLQDAQPHYCNGQPLHDGVVLICRPSDEQFAYSESATRWAHFAVPAEVLRARWTAFAGPEAEGLLERSTAVSPSPPALAALRAVLCEVLSALKTRPQMLATPQGARGVEETLLAAFFRAVGEGLAQSPGRPHNRRSQLSAVRRARQFIHDHLDAALYLGDLCAAAQVGERSLRDAFCSLLGTSPVRYVKNLRMSRARIALKRSDPHAASVQAVAARHGFADMSRFAVEYHRLFGELPSHTLRHRGDG